MMQNTPQVGEKNATGKEEKTANLETFHYIQ